MTTVLIVIWSFTAICLIFAAYNLWRAHEYEKEAAYYREQRRLLMLRRLDEERDR